MILKIILCLGLVAVNGYSAEILNLRSHTPEDFLNAWGGGDTDAAVHPRATIPGNEPLMPFSSTPVFERFINSFGWELERDESQLPAKLYKFNHLNPNTPPQNFGALPNGKVNSEGIIAHGKVWFFVKEGENQYLASAALKETTPNWILNPISQPGDITGFFLDHNGDPMVFVSGVKPDEEQKIAGRFTGGGASIEWSKPDTLPQNLARMERDSYREVSQNPRVYGEFNLPRPGSFLIFACNLNGETVAQIRCRVSRSPNELYSAWQTMPPDTTAPLNAEGQFLEYQIFYKDNKPSQERILPDIRVSYTYENLGTNEDRRRFVGSIADNPIETHLRDASAENIINPKKAQPNPQPEKSDSTIQAASTNADSNPNSSIQTKTEAKSFSQSTIPSEPAPIEEKSTNPSAPMQPEDKSADAEASDSSSAQSDKSAEVSSPERSTDNPAESKPVVENNSIVGITFSPSQSPNDTNPPAENPADKDSQSQSLSKETKNDTAAAEKGDEVPESSVNRDAVEQNPPQIIAKESTKTDGENEVKSDEKPSAINPNESSVPAKEMSDREPAVPAEKAINPSEQPGGEKKQSPEAGIHQDTDKTDEGKTLEGKSSSEVQQIHPDGNLTDNSLTKPHHSNAEIVFSDHSSQVHGALEKNPLESGHIFSRRQVINFILDYIDSMDPLLLLIIVVAVILFFFLLLILWIRRRIRRRRLAQTQKEEAGKKAAVQSEKVEIPEENEPIQSAIKVEKKPMAVETPVVVQTTKPVSVIDEKPVEVATSIPIQPIKPESIPEVKPVESAIPIPTQPIKSESIPEVQLLESAIPVKEQPVKTEDRTAAVTIAVEMPVVESQPKVEPTVSIEKPKVVEAIPIASAKPETAKPVKEQPVEAKILPKVETKSLPPVETKVERPIEVIPSSPIPVFKEQKFLPSGPWEEIRFFLPWVKTACIQEGQIVLLSDQGELCLYNPNEKSTTTARKVGQLPTAISNPKPAAERKRFVVMGETTGRPSAFFLRMGQDQKAQTIAYPDRLDQVDQVEITDNRLWILGNTKTGKTLFSAGITDGGIDTWREEKPRDLQEGRILAVSSGTRILTAGVPAARPKELFLFAYSPNRAVTGDWRCVSKVPFLAEDLFLYADAAQGLLFEMREEKQALALHLFSTNPKGRWSECHFNRLPLPFKTEFTACEIAADRIYLLGRDVTRRESAPWVFFSTPVANLLKSYSRRTNE